MSDKRFKPQYDSVMKVMIDAQEQRHKNHVEAGKSRTEKIYNLVRAENVSILTTILLWFLSDNIKVDEERLKRIFQDNLNQLKKDLKRK